MSRLLATFVLGVALTTSFIFILAGSLTMLVVNPQSPRAFYSGKAHTVYLHDVNFTTNWGFFDLSPSGDEIWETLTPANGGFARLGTQQDKQHAIGISMFHQLHCLKMIRDTLQDWEYNTTGIEKHSMHLHKDRHRHTLHCFDYLIQVRQA
ncbi:hypothetical protein LTR27_005976 [Elasticomyces elasticus]|nr:hypothetical protein LTR27_005976 [Elasticomyces elasticus]